MGFNANIYVARGAWRPYDARDAWIELPEYDGRTGDERAAPAASDWAHAA